jgi:putative ATP-binding cassette transporter
VFPILVAAPQYIMGAMTLGVLMQAAQAFQRLTGALSWPVDNVGEIARTARLPTGCSRSTGMRGSTSRRVRRGGDRVRPRSGAPVLDDVCIAEPSGLILLEHLSLELRRGERVLVAGDSAVTTALFKVIAGLWPWGSGRVLLPDDGGIEFMPQRPFLPEGTLREVLCYPRSTDAFGAEAIRYALECAGVVWLVRRLDEENGSRCCRFARSSG